MEITATSPMEGRVSLATKPRFSGFSHGSLPCRDLVSSKRFFIEVLGGELFHDTPGFAGAVIGLSVQSAGWTGWDAEYPHYAFFIEGDDYGPMKEWLESCGVPTYPWTRDHKKALLYFRDPSGNLFEVYCECTMWRDLPKCALPASSLGSRSKKAAGRVARNCGGTIKFLRTTAQSTKKRGNDRNRYEPVGGQWYD